MTRWRRRLMFLGLASLLLAPAPVSAQLRTVKLAASSKVIVDNLPVFVGMHMKFYEEVGMKVEPSYFRGGGEVVRAITTHSTELGLPGAGPSMIAIARGERLKILASGVGALVGIVWLVEADSPLKSLKAHAKAVRFIKENAERTIQIWAEELGLPVEAVRLAYRDLNKDVFEPATAPKPENLQGAMEEALAVGAIKQPLDLAKVVDLRFLPK